jgi:Domain of unknown function (DUF6875)
LLADWMRSYLMNAHPHLGRVGDVCPFTAQALRLDTVRIGVCKAGAGALPIIKQAMRDCLAQFELIPCRKEMRHFRTIVVGFPNADDRAGLQALKRVQNELKWYCLLQGLMIGRFYSSSNDPGLWNRDFRPFRAPLPVLAIRELVESDAAFAAKHPPLMLAYLCKYPLAAPKRLLDRFAHRRTSRLNRQ